MKSILAKRINLGGPGSGPHKGFRGLTGDEEFKARLAAADEHYKSAKTHGRFLNYDHGVAKERHLDAATALENARPNAEELSVAANAKTAELAERDKARGITPVVIGGKSGMSDSKFQKRAETTQRLIHRNRTQYSRNVQPPQIT